MNHIKVILKSLYKVLILLLLITACSERVVNERLISKEDVLKYFKVNHISVDSADRVYIEVNYEALANFTNTFRTKEYNKESWDCENIAWKFKIELSEKRTDKIEAESAVAVLSVQKPNGSYHANIGALTDKGMFLVEPQSRVIIPLSENKNIILKASL